MVGRLKKKLSEIQNQMLQKVERDRAAGIPDEAQGIMFRRGEAFDKIEHKHGRDLPEHVKKDLEGWIPLN